MIEQLATGNLKDQVINSQSACPEFPRLNGLAKSNPNPQDIHYDKQCSPHE